MVGDESRCVPHAGIDGVHDEPAFVADDFIGVERAEVTLRVGHAENEEAPDGGEHDDGFEPEESSELVRAEGAEGEMDEPKEEEGQHALGCDAD